MTRRHSWRRPRPSPTEQLVGFVLLALAGLGATVLGGLVLLMLVPALT